MAENLNSCVFITNGGKPKYMYYYLNLKKSPYTPVFIQGQTKRLWNLDPCLQNFQNNIFCLNLKIFLLGLKVFQLLIS